MGIEADIAAILTRLDAAINAAMEGPVLDAAKKQIAKTGQARVYDAYSPRFVSRRGAGGGLIAEENLMGATGDKELTIYNITPWQQLKGGAYPGDELAEAIAAGTPKYNFGRAGARSFMPEAEQEFGPEFERLIGEAVHGAGF